MHRVGGFCLFCCLTLLWNNMAWSGAEKAWSVVNKAIKAAGGEENLKKHQASTWTEKGTYYGMGEGVPYMGKLAIQFPGQFRMQVFGGDMEIFTLVVSDGKGWMKTPGETRAMTKEELKKQQVDLKAGWIASLLPLKDKAYTLKTIDGVDVDKKPTFGVQVTRKDYPDVKLYFDKKSNLLVKSEFQTFSNEQKKTVLAEFYFQNHKLIDGAQVPTRVVLKYDGKLFVETDIHDMKAAGTLDAKMFAAPK